MKVNGCVSTDVAASVDIIMEDEMTSLLPRLGEGTETLLVANAFSSRRQGGTTCSSQCINNPAYERCILSHIAHVKSMDRWCFLKTDI